MSFCHINQRYFGQFSADAALGLMPISAKILVWRFDRRMAFVPEGRHDSSQARSASVMVSGNCETLTLKAPSPCCQLKLCSCRKVWLNPCRWSKLS